MAKARLASAGERLPDPREALTRELEHALASLGARRRLDDDAAHELRRSIKRARALLHLVREAIGEGACRRENRALRDAARALGPMRDARVLRETLAGIGAHGAGSLFPRVPAAPVPPLQFAIGGARDRIANWRLPPPKWPAVARGIERLYRHSRDALRDAEAQPTDRNLHESRKQVKRLGAALAFLAPAGAKKVKKLARRAEAVAGDLGDDHDLALVTRRTAGRGLAPRLREKVRKRRRKLQKRALKDAGRLLRARPAKFLKRISRARIRA